MAKFSNAELKVLQQPDNLTAGTAYVDAKAEPPVLWPPHAKC